MPIESKAATSVALAFAAALLSASAIAQPSSTPSTAQATSASPAALAQIDQLATRLAPAAKEAPEPWMEMGPPTVCWKNGWCETGSPPIKF